MVKKDHVIRIEVQGGVVVGVEGLPRGYTYEVIDYDTGREVCDLCYEGNCPHSCHSKGYAEEQR